MYRRFLWRLRLRRRESRWQGLAVSVLLATALLAAFLTWMDRQIQPVLEAVAQAKVSSAVSAAVNEAVAASIAAEEISYDDMVVIETDGSGRAAVLKGNTAGMNLLRTQLLAAALAQVSELSAEDFSIPLGTLTQLELLSGRGPEVRVRLLSVGAADARFQNEFLEAGVNQTLHKIVLEVRVTAEILLPGRTMEVVVETPVCVAETVIIGQVPETYLQLESVT